MIPCELRHLLPHSLEITTQTKTMKHNQNKHSNLIDDLDLLISSLKLSKRTNQMYAVYDAKKDSDSYQKETRAYLAEKKSMKKWMKTPKIRREHALKVYQIAMSNARLALDLGGKTSSNIERKALWRSQTNATTTHDAHIVHLHSAGVVEMEKAMDVLAYSADCGLPVIELYRESGDPNVYRAAWVTTNKAMKLKKVDGWIAYDKTRDLVCHNIDSAMDAKANLRSRIEAFDAKLRYQQQLGGSLDQNDPDLPKSGDRKKAYSHPEMPFVYPPAPLGKVGWWALRTNGKMQRLSERKLYENLGK
jgi:hypothetical protein